MIKINLLPVSEKVREQNVRRQIMVGVLLILLAVVIMGYLWFLTYQQVAALKSDVSNMEKRLADLRKEVGDLSKLKNEREALDQRRETISSLSKNRLVTVEVLDKLCDAKPSAMYFTSLEQHNPAAPWQDFFLVLKGVATDNEVIAEFMRRLQDVDLLEDVDLDYTKAKSTKEGGGYKEFQLRINVALSRNPPPEGGKAKGRRG